MFLLRFSPFKQRKPRDFSYKPFYYKEDDDSAGKGTSPGDRIREAYAGAHTRGLRDKMEDRRHFGGGYDTAAGARKLIFLLALLGILALIYFVYL